jgi:hypothetical protein
MDVARRETIAKLLSFSETDRSDTTRLSGLAPSQTIADFWHSRKLSPRITSYGEFIKTAKACGSLRWRFGLPVVLLAAIPKTIPNPDTETLILT